MNVADANRLIEAQGLEVDGRFPPRWQPNSPAWYAARERELAAAIHAINYHSHRRAA